MGLATYWAIFFTNSSGHPGCQQPPHRKKFLLAGNFMNYIHGFGANILTKLYQGQK
jgi:hypothetical protein